MFNNAFGIQSKIITGYSNSNQILQGFLRGDGDFITDNVSALTSAIPSRAAVPLAVNIACPAKASFAPLVKGVPTYAQLLKKYPPKTAHERAAANFLFATTHCATEALITQSKVPAAETAALRWAIQQAEQNKDDQAQLNTSGNPYGWTSGPQAKADYASYLSVEKKIYEYLGISTASS